MSWVAVSVSAGVGLLNSKMSADQQNKNQNIQNQLAAEKERTSYITGRGGETSFGAPNPYAAMLQGGVTGAASGLAMGQQFKAKDPSMTSVPNGQTQKPNMFSSGPSSYNNMMNKTYNPNDYGL